MRTLDDNQFRVQDFETMSIIQVIRFQRLLPPMIRFLCWKPQENQVIENNELGYLCHLFTCSRRLNSEIHAHSYAPKQYKYSAFFYQIDSAQYQPPATIYLEV